MIQYVNLVCAVVGFLSALAAARYVPLALADNRTACAWRFGVLAAWCAGFAALNLWLGLR